MDVTLNRRAEIAFRSLTAGEQAQVSRILGRIRRVPDGRWRQVSRARKLLVPGDVDLFAIRASDKLRIVATSSPDAVTVEDIVPAERLSAVAASRPA